MPTTTTTTTTVDQPKAEIFDASHYLGNLADAAVHDLTEKGYSATVIKDSDKQAITTDFSRWRVVSILTSRYTGMASVYVKNADPTPAEKVDLAVDQAGITPTLPASYASASALVTDVCRSAGLGGKTLSPTEFLAAQVSGNSQELEILKIGIPALCPDLQGALQDVIDGNIPFGNGTYEIGAGDRKIKPGTYRTTGSVDNCYWERTRPNGEIIDNNFATHATSITVTISPSDGSFTSERCGTWQLVK
ncbi:hypothetical protein KALB_8276 [Kutzneria albida DSM 43870]|uniref:Uncharacterized protein n=2 Tax=Kutzneria TaxID=43356 RepID=W5WLE4_9PSEU|nr:hypothetical protein KALB_8276 [Kutzneria albida DSM 43870]